MVRVTRDLPLLAGFPVEYLALRFPPDELPGFQKSRSSPSQFNHDINHS